MTLLSLSFIVKEMQLHSVSPLFQLYFYNTVPWINQRITLLIMEISKSLKLQLFLIKSDMKAVAPDGSLYLSSTDVLSTALSYLSDILRLFLQTISGGNMEEQTSPVCQALMQCVRAKDLPPSLYICNSNTTSRWFKILIDSLHEPQFCSSHKEVQKYECNSAVA